MKSDNTNHHIKSISVTRLFGRYSYALPATLENLTDLNILYGENGAGKTTLLSLVFHLISPAANKNHKTQISETPFENLCVILNDGTTLTASKDKQLLLGPTEYEIVETNGSKTKWKFNQRAENSIDPDNLPAHLDLEKLPRSVRDDVKRALEQKQYFEKLATLEISCYMLTSDRILLGDGVEEPLKRDQRIEAHRARAKLSHLFVEYRNESVKDALNAAYSWLQRRFLDGTFSGSSAAPFEDIVKKIAKTTYKTNAGLNKIQEAKVIADLEKDIEQINLRTKEFQKFDLGGRFVSSEILSSIQSTKGNRLNLLNSILEPHLAGLTSRLDSIEPIYELTNVFVRSINKFFRDKKLEFSVRYGFKIFTYNKEHEELHESENFVQRDEIFASQLSSGEQQLILLFCYVLTARSSSCVFIIDEPEISLNILWQRMLVSSLHELAQGSKVQLIFASHSMEILSKHRNRVITMEEKSVV